MAVIANLIVKVSAHTKSFRDGLRRSGRRIAAFRSKVAGLASSLRFIGPGAAIFGGFKLLQSAEEFQRAMQRSLSVMGEVSQAMRGDMVQAALQVASVTTFAANEVAQAYFFLASAGLDAEQSVAAVGAVAEFAQASYFDLSRATKLLIGAQNTLGMSSDNAADNLAGLILVSNVLTKANQIAQSTQEQFAEALTNKVGTAARNLGKTIEETVAVLAVFASQEKTAAEAGTALDIVWRDLQTKSIKNAKAWKDLGVEVFDTAGKMRHTADIIENLEDKLLGLSDRARRAQFILLGFSDKSVSSTQSLLGFSEAIRENEARLTGLIDTTKMASAEMLTPFQKAWNRLTAALSTVGLLLQPLVTAFAWVIGAIATVLNAGVKAILSTIQVAFFALQKLAEAGERLTGVDFGADFLASRVALVGLTMKELFKDLKPPDLGEVPRPEGGGKGGGAAAAIQGSEFSAALVKGSAAEFSARIATDPQRQLLAVAKKQEEHLDDIRTEQQLAWDRYFAARRQAQMLLVLPID